MLDSKLVSFRFRIERKCIKVGARETRRASIHKLEVEIEQIEQLELQCKGGK